MSDNPVGNICSVALLACCDVFAGCATNYASNRRSWTHCDCCTDSCSSQCPWCRSCCGDGDLPNRDDDSETGGDDAEESGSQRGIVSAVAVSNAVDGKRAVRWQDHINDYTDPERAPLLGAESTSQSPRKKPGDTSLRKKRRSIAVSSQPAPTPHPSITPQPSFTSTKSLVSDKSTVSKSGPSEGETTQTQKDPWFPFPFSFRTLIWSKSFGASGSGNTGALISTPTGRS